MTKKLCFIHIPKCGGTSLNEAFRNSRGVSKYSWSYYKLSSSRTRKTSERRNIDMLNLRKEILEGKLSNSRFKYLTGHFRCTEEIRKRHEDQWDFITVLRDPVKRWISEFFFNTHKKSDHFKIRIPLDEFLQTDIAQRMGSKYIDYFTDGTTLRDSIGIKSSIETIENYSLVGILENLDQFKTNFKKTFQTELVINERNKNPLSKSEMDKGVSEDQMKVIKEYCQPDIEVYQHFVSKLDK